MKRSVLALLGLCAACGTTRSYVLGGNGQAGPSGSGAFDPLASCATQRGLQSHRMDDGLQVRVDTGAYLQYRVGDNGELNMDINVDEKSAAGGNVEGAFANAKAKGDELYGCATSRQAMRATPPAGSASASSDKPQGSSCSQLAQCYADIKKQVCPATQPDCNAVMRINTSGDEPGCRSALTTLAAHVEPLGATNPRFEMPTSCRANTNPSAANTSAAGVAGNWMVSVAYKWSCTVPMGNAQEGTDKGTWTMKLDNSGRDLSAEVQASHSGYNLNGNGNGQKMRLCGAFPLKGKGGVAGTRDNNVCLTAEQAGSNALKGRLEGSYVTEIGIDCKVLSADAELSQ